MKNYDTYDSNRHPQSAQSPRARAAHPGRRPRKTKRSNRFFFGGIAAAVGAVIAFIGRFALAMEVKSVENSSALIVISGSKEMTRSEYFASAASTMSSCTAVAVICLILAAALLLLHRRQSALK